VPAEELKEKSNLSIVLELDIKPVDQSQVFALPLQAAPSFHLETLAIVCMTPHCLFDVVDYTIDA
jgi:hypothetical protein